ncbi:MAG: 30S ribosomal protein S12 methylthiotransferase RimO [Gemmatimonadaceae bacterium]|nr:30S ribosomal protein S12 methylthiotransferase RimO [Gemmatimonadaceae bacterium]
MKVAFITLGCDKNTVDSERYLGMLVEQGAVAVDEPAGADVVVINTCGFIDAAKRESIDAIVAAARLKEASQVSAVVAVGCMVQRHEDELREALPEVDLFVKNSEWEQLVPRLRERGLLDGPETLHPGVRAYAGGTPHVRYLKLSEGCDHGCAFCAIPLMRGRHRSFALADVIREAQLLELQGARELNLVAQDLAHYGRDRRDGAGLAEALEALARETSIPWIRMMYLYPAGITPRLLEVVAREPRIVPYLDMPIQHASDPVLERMRRPERRRTIREKVALFRDAVPGVALRTTCIVGFPGETDADFRTLADFLEEVQFERVGIFAYSAQEGTRAAEMPDDVPDSIKRERVESLEEIQRGVTELRYASRIGSRVDALALSGATARLPWQADDIDGTTQLDCVAAPGAIVEVEVTGVDEYDFAARVIGVRNQPPPVAARPGTRSLPVVSMGAFGR